MSERGFARAEWPGFRGPGRDGVIRGVRIATDWSRRRRSQLWRRPIGPGWSSFAVRGDLVYTQEQRGEDEVVSCYRLTPASRCGGTATRSGSGSRRAAPVRARRRPCSDGRVYTFGATGIVNALDAGNGAVVWSRNAGDRHRRRRSRAGASRARRWWSATSSSSPPPAGSSPTTSPPASRAGSARPAAAATARHISRRSTASRRSCC